MVRLDGAREKGLNSKHINAKWKKKKNLWRIELKVYQVKGCNL